MGHDPTDYPHYYHARLYKPLNLRTFKHIEYESSKTPYLSTRNFYFMSNGLSLFGDLDIFGVLYDSASKAGQPISLSYGNIYEVPSGLPKNSIVIGGVQAATDRVDYLVSHENGGISQSYGAKEYKEVSNWPNIFVCIEDFITKNMKSLNLV